MSEHQKTTALYSQINKSISRYVPFSKEEFDIFNSLLEYKKVPKKTILLHEGEMCNFEAFVIKGCVRKYYIDANGFEVILQFAIENAWISDISFSIYEDCPSRVYIETIEDCEFFMFSPETKETLFAKAPKFERAFRINFPSTSVIVLVLPEVVMVAKGSGLLLESVTIPFI